MLLPIRYTLDILYYFHRMLLPLAFFVVAVTTDLFFVREVIGSVDHETEESENPYVISGTIIAGLPVIMLAAFAYARLLFYRIHTISESTHEQSIQPTLTWQEFRESPLRSLPVLYEKLPTISIKNFSLLLGPGLFAGTAVIDLVALIRKLLGLSPRASSIELAITIPTSIVFATTYGLGYMRIYGDVVKDEDDISGQTGFRVLLKQFLKALIGKDQANRFSPKLLWYNWALFLSHLLETGLATHYLEEICGIEQNSILYWIIFSAITVLVGFPFTVVETLALVDEMAEHARNISTQHLTLWQRLKQYFSVSSFAGFAEIAAPTIALTNLLKWLVFKRTLEPNPEITYVGPFESRYNEILFSMIIFTGCSIFLLPNLLSLVEGLLREQQPGVSTRQRFMQCLLPCIEDPKFVRGNDSESAPLISFHKKPPSSPT